MRPILYTTFPTALLSACALMTIVAAARAQDMEPRAYSNVPVGMNFLIAGYINTQGNVAFDPSVPLTDAHLHTNSAVVAYARSLDSWGLSSKFDMVLPYTWVDGSALYVGQPATRDVSGFADPRLRYSVNFFGAPALSLQDYKGYQQDIIIGASLQVTAPAGQYDPGKLVNIGTNRWSFKPELGISKSWGDWVLEIAPSVTYYTDNNDFLNGGTLTQAPIYALQGHVIHSFDSGIWVAVDGVYFTGGLTTSNGVTGDNEMSNTRMGVTLALPVDRQDSVKFNFSTGTSTRTGSDFTALGVAWQYRWGAGF
jgi:hypothetical protein